jgi:hypothetical protein
VVAALLCPAAASAAVQSGSTTRSSSSPSDSGLDITGASAEHDTAGRTTVTIRLAGTPSSNPQGLLRGIVGVEDAGGTCTGRIQLAATTDPGGFTLGTSVDDSGTATDITVTRTTSGTTVTLTTPNARAGGGAVDCAFVESSIGTKNVVDDTSFDLTDPTPAPTPTPTTTAPTTPTTPTPKPAPTPPPAAVPGAPEGAPAYRAPGRTPSLSRKGRSAVYGICGPSVCRVDPVTRKRVRVLRGGAKSARYTAVSTSVSGGALAFQRDGVVFAAGRDGKKPRKLAQGDVPAVRPDGRVVAWEATDVITQGPICSGGIGGTPVICYPQAPLRAPSVFYDVGAKGRVHSTGVTTKAWLGDNLLVDDDPPAERSIWTTTTKGGVARAVAKEPGRTLNDPAGSPDGRYVVVSSEASPADPKGKLRYRGRIALFDARTGTKVRDLTTGTGDASPVFSPDGRQVAFDRGSAVYVVPAKGGKAKRLASGFQLTGPSWSLTH